MEISALGVPRFGIQDIECGRDIRNQALRVGFRVSENERLSSGNIVKCHRTILFKVYVGPQTPNPPQTPGRVLGV